MEGIVFWRRLGHWSRSNRYLHFHNRRNRIVVSSTGRRSGVGYGMVSHEQDLTVELILQMAAELFLLISRSPSARHLLASTNCTTFTYCLESMKLQETHRRVQGTRVSILFALHQVSAATSTRLSMNTSTIGLPGHLHRASTPWCCPNLRRHRARLRLF